MSDFRWSMVGAAASALLASAPTSNIEHRTSQLQLQAFDDTRHFDQPGLYAVLRDVAQWSNDGDAASIGAVVPDVEALLANPEAHRGRRVLLRARTAGRVRAIDLLREGAWPNPIPEVGLHLANDASRPAVLLLTGDVPPRLDRSRVPIEAPARFLGLWPDADASGAARAYPVFVSRPGLVQVRGEAAAEAPPETAAVPITRRLFPLLLLLVLAAALAWRLRRLVAGRPPIRHRLGARDPHDPLTEPPVTDLPADPAEALRELDRRRSDQT